MKPQRRLRLLAIAAAVLLYPALAAGQIRTDGSLGQAARTLAGPDYAIPESLGRRSGNNLFHSFQTFRIGTGEAAVFSTTTPTLANVISRVTGGELSTIDGLIRLQAAGGAPALFLINPAGVTFGPGASIDVPGAFRVSTADYVKFPDGNFYVDPAKASTFSSAPPEAFGFLGERRASVTIAGAALFNGDSAFNIVAGDIELSDGGLIENAGGDVTVAAAGRQVTQVPLTGPTGAIQGNLQIGAGSYLATYGEGTQRIGDVRVEAGRIEATGMPGRFTGITSVTAGDGAGGRVIVRADEALSLADGAVVATYADGAGRGGDLTVRSGRLLVDGRETGRDTGVISSGSAGGRSGDVSVAAGHVELRGYGVVASYSRLSDSGTVGVTADTVDIEGVFSGIVSSAEGVSGGVVMEVARTLRVADRGEIRSSAFGSLPAGGIRIQAGEVSIERGEIRTGGSAGRGEITVVARDALTMTDFGRISSDSGGAVRVEAQRIVLNDSLIESNNYEDSGSSGEMRVTAADLLQMENSSAIQSRNIGLGNGGTVFVGADRLLMDRSSILSYASSGRGGDVQLAVSGAALLANRSQVSSDNGVGDASSTGNITIGARELVIYNSSISSNNLFSAGRAGDITVDVAGRLWILNDGDSFGSSISSSHQGSGPRGGMAGNMTIRAGTLWIENAGPDDSSTGLGTSTNDGTAGRMDVEVRGEAVLRRAYLTSTTSGDGDGGAIRMRVGEALTIENSAITSSSFAQGRAGGLEIEARSIHLMATPGEDARGLGWYSSISSDGTGLGGAGSISVNAADSLTLAGRSSITTDTRGAGNAGRVQVGAGSLLIHGAGARIASSGQRLPGATGDAGSIDLRVDGELKILDGGEVSSSAGFGAAGAISIDAGNVRVAGQSPDGTAPTRIAATTFAESSGQAGNLLVVARGRITVADGAEITVQNDALAADAASLPRGVLALAAPLVDVKGGTISAASTGNVAASDIAIDAGQGVAVERGRITTSATGSAGDGGNIRITAPALALHTGFVQSNATAPLANGGNIALAVDALLTSHDSLRVGGNTPVDFDAAVAGLNVIQAAAPTGVSGSISITSPQLDLAGSLVLLTANVIPAQRLGKSPCQGSAGSSLALGGRGGLPPSTQGPAGSYAALPDAGTWPLFQLFRIAERAGCPTP